MKLSFVMPGLVPGIHVLDYRQNVDGRDKPGHDGSDKLLIERWQRGFVALTALAVFLFLVG
jgi:hypothetical protein